MGCRAGSTRPRDVAARAPTVRSCAATRTSRTRCGTLAISSSRAPARNGLARPVDGSGGAVDQAATFREATPRCSEPDALASAYAPNAWRGLTRTGSARDTSMPFWCVDSGHEGVVRCRWYALPFGAPEAGHATGEAPSAAPARFDGSGIPAESVGRPGHRREQPWLAECRYKTPDSACARPDRRISRTTSGVQASARG
jgi:hypothetical protein